MAKEYIDREEALSNIDKAFKMFQDHNDILRLYSDVRLAVIEEPAADAAPVVRYKDCKHFAPRADKKYGICLVVKGTVPISVPANHWCSFGERCTKRNNHERIHRA